MRAECANSTVIGFDSVSISHFIPFLDIPNVSSQVIYYYKFINYDCRYYIEFLYLNGFWFSALKLNEATKCAYIWFESHLCDMDRIFERNYICRVGANLPHQGSRIDFRVRLIRFRTRLRRTFMIMEQSYLHSSRNIYLSKSF